jgi:hypothetical protein
VNVSNAMLSRPRTSRASVAVALATVSALAIAAPVFADTISVQGRNSGQYSTATVVCEFNSQTNTFTFTTTNMSAITQPGSTSTITGLGFDLPPAGNANSSGLNGFTGMQAPSLSSNFDFSDADVGAVPGFSSAVLDFAFVTGSTFDDGSSNDGLLPGESASFTVSGAAFTGFTESQICNAIYARFENVPVLTEDVGTAPVPKPDGRIKRSGGVLFGNDIYNTTADGQTVSLRNTGGSLRRFYVTVQNDGNTADSFHVQATGTTPPGYIVRYFRSRTNTELTTAIEAGTFVTPELGPGQIFRIRVRVQTTAAAPRDSQLTRLLTITSDEDADQKDAVQLKVTRI